jgi:DNA invertase Pin-like site-specific DNA recombinase
LTTSTKSESAIGYIRVSTDDQHLGPEAQLHDLERWCERHEVELLATFTDHGVSGGKGLDSKGLGLDLKKRPALMDAIQALKDRDAGILLVAKRDRLARDAMLAAMVERLLERSGAVVRSADGVGGGDGPADRFQRQILDAASEYERALIRARTAAALAAKRRKGEKTGGQCPYGWRAVEGPDGKLLLAPDPDEARVVEWIGAMRAAGLSYQKVADRLNAEAIPARGTRWHKQTVVRLCKESPTAPAGTVGPLP